ncbi:MAG: excinuclease ABC subunit UvrC [Chromatiales bacterium]|nr:excinuclease ABC subunit UvrC [Chromatiales bacterium]
MSNVQAAAFDPDRFLRGLTQRPGVYRMYDASDQLLYVGKARNLRKRVSSYFRRAANARILSMVAQIARIEVTVTNTGAEALLLENQLIKQYKPRYNVQLRDDKSYPYIHLSGHPFPRLALHRGARGAGRYFGPYASASAVRMTLRLMQKLIPVRQCEDGFFRTRSRPCLQHQIGRCTAPCVGRIDETGYARDVRHAELFLRGRSNALIEELGGEMERASTRLDFEHAARVRDRIAALRQVMARQYVSRGNGDVDVVACRARNGIACVSLFLVRNGLNLGQRSFFPHLPPDADAAEVLAAFLAQHYVEHDPPPLILTDPKPEEALLLESAFTERVGRRVRIERPQRGERRRWMELAEQNAETALDARLGDRETVGARIADLALALGLSERPGTLECFDVSHTGGEGTVASCVVFDRDGPAPARYRRFNIRDITPGDDYAALGQALRRRYRPGPERFVPDLIIVDGGKGQLRVAREALAEVDIDTERLLGVVKGEGRRAALDRIVDAEGEDLDIEPDAPGRRLLQHLRDEAHRFAIAGHRARRQRTRTQSPLEAIEGLGPKRRQALLRTLGGLREVREASIEQLAQVPGINRALAERIYETFHT